MLNLTTMTAIPEEHTNPTAVARYDTEMTIDMEFVTSSACVKLFRFGFLPIDAFLFLFLSGASLKDLTNSLSGLQQPTMLCQL